MLLAQLVVEYIADTSKLVSSVQNVKQSAEEGAASLRNMATAGAAVATAALIGVGVASTKMAGDFQAGITSLETGAGELHKNLGMVGDGIKQIAIDTGTGTKDLISAMFMIESSGQRGADALNVLRIAAEGAKTDNADLTTTTNALTGIMTNFKIPAKDAAGAMNELIAASKAGKMHLEDLSGALGPIGEVAVNAGLKFADVGGAIAMMTNANVSARQASQNLAFAIRSLDAPSGVAVKSLASVGLKAQDVADTLRNQGLPAALQLIEDHVGKKFPQSSVEWTTAMKNIMGGKAGLNVALAIGGDNLQAYEKNVNDISAALKAGGTSVEGWSQVQGNFNTKMAQAQATVEVLGINIGTKLLPVLGKALDAFSSPAFQQFATTVAGALTSALLGLINAVSTVAGWISQLVSFFQHNQAAAMALQVGLATLAGIILGALVVAFAMGAASAATVAIGFLAVAWPVMLIVGAVVGLVALLVILYQRFEPVRVMVNAVGQMFQQVWNILVQSFTPAWQQLVAAFQQAAPAFQLIGQIIGGVLVVAIGILISAVVGLATGIAAAVGGIVQIFTGLVQIVTGVFNILGGIVMFFVDLFTGRFDKLGSDLGRIWQGIIQIFQGAWNVIAGVFNAAFGFIGGLVSGFINGIVSFFQHLFDVLVGHSIIPDMINGIVTWFINLNVRAIQLVIQIITSVISWFMKLPGEVGNAIQSMINTVINLLHGFLSTLFNIGANIVNSIANGIRSAIGAVGSAIGAVTQFISDHLPHSPAKIGPLVGLQDQGMEISNQISKGMINGVPLINSAIGNLAKPIALGVKGASTPTSSPLQGGNQQIIVYNQVTLDGKDITNSVMKRAQKSLRGHGLKI